MLDLAFSFDPVADFVALLSLIFMILEQHRARANSKKSRTQLAI
jgi:hypothetical protein